ncbi:MAG: DUF167 domain-containing protein [Verrucomicrobia bacterium]|nr:DUF167 domain-containing protein [Verrucomicrobiota bacterium]
MKKNRVEKITISVKVIPNSSKNSVVGYENGVLKIRLRAVPEKGEANKALISFLADLLGIPKSHIELVQGATARLKRLALTNFSQEQFDAFLSPL